RRRNTNTDHQEINTMSTISQQNPPDATTTYEEAKRRLESYRETFATFLLNAAKVLKPLGIARLHPRQKRVPNVSLRLLADTKIPTKIITLPGWSRNGNEITGMSGYWRVEMHQEHQVTKHGALVTKWQRRLTCKLQDDGRASLSRHWPRTV